MGRSVGGQGNGIFHEFEMGCAGHMLSRAAHVSACSAAADSFGAASQRRTLPKAVTGATFTPNTL
jgi:hypothetical protein